MQPEGVTRTAAVRMLVPQLQALQSKGYTLAAIARVLADNGVPLAAVAIKNLLTEETGAKKMRERRKAHAKTAAPGPGQPHERRRRLRLGACKRARDVRQLAIRRQARRSRPPTDRAREGVGDPCREGRRALRQAPRRKQRPLVRSATRVLLRARTRMTSDGHEEVTSAVPEGTTVVW